jgi:hypothetical protein
VNRDSMLPPQSLHARNFSTIHAASPTGESFKPGARLCGFVDWISAYVPSFYIHCSFFLKNCVSAEEGSSGFRKICPKGTSVR